MLSFQRQRVTFAIITKLLGTLENNDGDGNGNGNGNVKKAIYVYWVNQQLCTCISLFCTFPFSPCTTTTWNEQILSLLGNRNGEAINSTVSVRIQARSLLFSSNPNSLLLSNWTPWNNRKKVKGCKVYFSATFSWTSLLSDRKVPDSNVRAVWSTWLRLNAKTLQIVTFQVTFRALNPERVASLSKYLCDGIFADYFRFRTILL